MLNFCDFIQVYVFTTNHHLKAYRYTFRGRFSGIYIFPPFSIGINSLSSGRKISHLIIGLILEKSIIRKKKKKKHQEVTKIVPFCKIIIIIK